MKKKIKKAPKLTVEQALKRARSRLKHLDFKWKPTEFLKTGDEYLDSVLGSVKKGIPYGKILEFAGDPSQGKSLLANDVAAVAQQEGAIVVWVDFENSFDPAWATKRGLDCTKIVLIQPYVGRFGKDKKKRLSTAEELLAETEEVLTSLHQAHGGKFFTVVDSVAAMLVEAEGDAGLGGQNLNTNTALARMLGQLTRRWVGLMQTINGITIFINQLREKPMAFGDPTYTVGGKSIPFYAHSRIRLRRVGPDKGKMRKANKVIGIKGIITNVKNKMGGVEGAQCGYKFFNKGHAKFFSASEIKKG